MYVEMIQARLLLKDRAEAGFQLTGVVLPDVSIICE